MQPMTDTQKRRLFVDSVKAQLRDISLREWSTVSWHNLTPRQRDALWYNARANVAMHNESEG